MIDHLNPLFLNISTLSLNNANKVKKTKQQMNVLDWKHVGIATLTQIQDVSFDHQRDLALNFK